MSSLEIYVSTYPNFQGACILYLTHKTSFKDYNNKSFDYLYSPMKKKSLFCAEVHTFQTDKIVYSFSADWS